MDHESTILLLVLFVYNSVSVWGIQHVSVSCSQQEICALRESSVNLTCAYSNISITTGFWFSVKDKAKWWMEDRPEDLALDSDYAGRARYAEMTNFSSTLTITDLRERDSGEYRLVIVTDNGERYQSSAGVTVTVTDLQVKHNTTARGLTCYTSCPLTSVFQRYHWYGNGQYLQKYTDNEEMFKYTEESSYSCSVEGYNNILSKPLCVGRKCWNVIYTDTRVCVLKGSSVEFAGNYWHPSDLRVSLVYWNYFKPKQPFQDLNRERQFATRVEYVKEGRNHTLKMKKVRKEDSGEYHLRFITNNNEGFSGKPGVILNVTDLQVKASRSAVESQEETTVTLSCITSCTLSNNPTYMWYKNGQPVTNKLAKHNKLYLKSSEDAGTYSCAVRGREDLRSPEETVTWNGNKTAIIVGVSVFLVLIIIAGVLWKWRKSRSNHTKGTDPQSEQVYLHYSSIRFPPSDGGEFPRDAAEPERVQYAEVNIKRPAAATR